MKLSGDFSSENLLSSCPLSKNVNIKIYKNYNFTSKSLKIIGICRIFHNEELHILCSSPDIITMTRSRKMRWAEHVALMRRREIHVGIWWERQNERDNYEDAEVSGTIILKLILEK
jgi:hypothetical protein